MNIYWGGNSLRDDEERVPMRRKIKAKYKGHCYECGGIILPGDSVVWDSSESGNLVWCEDCDRGLFPQRKQ